MKQPKTLIFPSCMPRSIEYSGQAQREGISVIGSSSLVEDFSKSEYPDWFYLPLLSDDDFLQELDHAIAKYNISSIYSPNTVVWGFLEQNLKRLNNKIELVNESPVERELYPYRRAHAFYDAYSTHETISASTLKGAKKLTDVQVKSIFRHVETIPGMCDHEKTLALLEIARYCPKGDIVEIGTWWGKSAFVFNQISQLYQIGNVLCVDPWSDDELIQNTELVDVLSTQVSASEAFDVFISNIFPYSRNLNYLKMTSIEASKLYCKSMKVDTEELGCIDYKGEVAILHIDGNHCIASVALDIDSWHHHVVDNGWIIFDDYFWPYGDGPKVVGDKFLKDNADRINSSFVKGGALFIQIMKN